MKTLTIYASIACICSLLIGGCSQKTIDSVTSDTKHNVAVVDKAAAKVGEEIKPQVDKAEKQAKPAMDKLSLGARVTAALQANANLPRTIRVDAGTDGVRLRGVVETKQQKILAGTVAKQTLPAGKSVTNQLAINPKPSH
jgi:osmotically-inducible protein OsmY